MPKIVEVMPRIGVVAKTKPLWQYDSWWNGGNHEPYC